MILCPKCKKLIDDDSVYCPYCATEFRTAGNFFKKQDARETQKKAKSIVTALAALLIGVIALTYVVESGWLDFDKSTSHEKNTNVAASNKSASSKANTNVRAVPEPVNLPDELFFMSDLDPKKNNDGTYSFRGRFTSYKFSPYSNTPTLYITAVNGREFSTGDTSLYYQMYINNSGEYSVVLSDILYAPAQIRGIIFEFVYDRNGNFVTLRQ